MQTAKVTEMAGYRLARQQPVLELCRWSLAAEQLALRNVQLAFALHREWLRYLGLV